MQNHHPLPARAKPVTEVNGAVVALLPPTGIDGVQYILVENTLSGLCFAMTIDPERTYPPETCADGYLRVAQTAEVGVNIVHLVDTLAEIQRRAPALIQLPLANLTDL